MGTSFVIDLTDQTPETADTGGKLEKGWYLALVDDVFEDKNGNTKFQFAVTAPPGFVGQKTWDSLFDPDTSQTDDQAKKAKQRMNLFASRLGLIKPDAFGRQAEIDFKDAIGTPVVLHLIEKPQKDQVTGQPTGHSFTNVDWGGVFPPDHEKIPPDVRASLSLPPARTSDKSKTAATSAPTATTPASQPATRANGQRPQPAAPRSLAPIDVSDL